MKKLKNEMRWKMFWDLRTRWSGSMAVVLPVCFVYKSLSLDKNHSVLETATQDNNKVSVINYKSNRFRNWLQRTSNRYQLLACGTVICNCNWLHVISNLIMFFDYFCMITSTFASLPVAMELGNWQDAIMSTKQLWMLWYCGIQPCLWFLMTIPKSTK